MNPGESFAAIALFLLIGAVAFPLVRAIATRISGGAPNRELLQEVQSLRDEVDQLRGEVGTTHGELDQVQERLDFAERMLAQVKAREALPGGRT